MLIQTVLVGLDDPLRSRIARALPAADTAIVELEPGDFWSRPESQTFDLAVVAHQHLPADFPRAVEEVRRLAQRPEVVIYHADTGPQDATSLLAGGAFAVLPGGLSDRQLSRALAKLVARRREVLQVRLRADGPAQAPLSVDELSSRSPATQKVLDMARRVATSDASLLILGETGVGKDWLARAVHGESPRATAPFIAVNCGAVPETLLESELFGHVRGAFTGAVKDRRGYFELAHRGTLFLDEIGEMPPHLQVRLLRVLQDRIIQRLGSEEEIEVDVRIIAATHRDLRQALVEGRFRQDLYYRLAVVTLTMPALQERLEDLPDLVELYRRKLVAKLGRSEIRGVTPEAMAALQGYSWPGNVRELINVVERAVLLCDGSEIGLADLPQEIAAPAGLEKVSTEAAAAAADVAGWFEQPLEISRAAVVEDFERRYFTYHLARNRGSMGKTAEQAGIDPRTLYSKMRQLGLRKEDFKRP